MFSHIMIGSNDIARSKKVYDALFVAMGAQPGVEVVSGGPAITRLPVTVDQTKRRQDMTVKFGVRIAPRLRKTP